MPILDKIEQEVIENLMRSYGQEQSLRYVYSLLCLRTKCTHMIVTYRYVDQNNTLIVACMTPARARFNYEWVMDELAPPKVRDVYYFASTAHPLYCSNASQPDSVLGAKLREIFGGEGESFYCIPLFVYQGYGCHMTFASLEKDAFSDEELAFFYQCARIVGAFLEESLSPQLTLHGTADVWPENPKERLSMCGGLLQLSQLVEYIAPKDVTVLIQGETGSGKEIVAQAIHQGSLRAKNAFVQVNCGAIAESLLMAEFFGFEKGSFTGAMSTRPGYFEQADGGTLFLDEVAELSPGGQAALLRVLSAREIMRVGSPRAHLVNVRIIAATHRDLKERVREGTFRQDLFYRLNVFPLNVPPLRERRMDIPVLANYFASLYAKKTGISPIVLPQNIMHRLNLAAWPGNVRELEHTIERILLLHDAGQPYEQAFPEDLNAVAPRSGGADSPNDFPTLDGLVSSYLWRVLEHTQGKIKGEDGACAILDISPSTLRNKMRHYNIVLSEKRKISRNRRKEESGNSCGMASQQRKISSRAQGN